MLPQIAQGALAVECRADDGDTHDRLVAIDDTSAHRAVDAERAFLAELGGGCDQPVGALARVIDNGDVEIEGLVASYDGRVVVRTSVADSDAQAAGRALATSLRYAEEVTG
jgi:hydroxymethylbilane synthase